eukprot:7084544-Pyramimonas_sp.AAC.1
MPDQRGRREGSPRVPQGVRYGKGARRIPQREDSGALRGGREHLSSPCDRSGSRGHGRSRSRRSVGLRVDGGGSCSRG